MNEIKCPNCGEVFTVNESQYAELLSQVRTTEFDKELHDRMRQELALAEQKAMNEQQTKLAQKDQEIAQLQSQIQNFDTEKELAKKEVEQTSHQALLAKDKEVQALENQLATLRLEHENQLQWISRFLWIRMTMCALFVVSSVIWRSVAVALIALLTST